MNQFSNPGNRSIELPFGCKDLIDVLQKLKSGTGQNVADFYVESGRIDHSNVGQTEKYLARLFSSKASNRVLGMAVSSKQIALNIFCRDGGAHLVFVLELERWDVSLETTIESLFGKKAFREIDRPDLRAIDVRLPDSPIEAARTLSNLLVDGFGIEREQEVMFHYTEFD